MKLIKLLLEQEGAPKVLVMAGGGGAGKTTFLKQAGIQNVPILNPDKFVEDQDIPLAAASKMVEKQVDQFTEEGKSFVWDTTASNPQKVRDLLSKGYEVMMVMVYTHPLISFFSNFERERRIPKAGVFGTWESAYSLIEQYRKMLGENFLLIQNNRGGKYDKQIKDFNQAAGKGPEALKDFLDSLGIDTKSTFSKPFSLPKDQEEEFQTLLDQSDVPQDDESALKELRKDFAKNSHLYDKQGPGRLDTRFAAIESRRQKANERYYNLLEKIGSMVNSPELKQLKTNNPEEVMSKARKFLA